VIKDTVQRGGKLIIPAFALGRVEELLYWINRLEEQRRIPELPVYVDSPMATKVLEEYRSRLEELDPEMAARRGGNGHRNAAERKLCAFCTARLRVVTSIGESREVQESRATSIVISSSGMATGGRVLHHLKAALPDPRNSVLLVGFQAAGTRGRSLADGAPAVKIHGQMIPVHAHIEKIDSMSAHADSQEIMRWLGGFKRPPRMTFLVHGEPVAMEALQALIKNKLGWPTKMPEHGERVDLP
jgi:metallo-beta-lactamase family protein